MAKSNTTVLAESSKSLLPYLTSEGALTLLSSKKLNNPFDPADVSFKPTDVKYDENECTALAYADKRVYEERLDEVFGPQNWSVDIHAFVGPFRKVTKAKYDRKDKSKLISEEKILDGHKIFTIVTINVNGLGHKTSTAVSETDDENSIMTAEAQAFKRSASMYGIGKYFYFLPRVKCKYAYGKIQDPPILPDWATPEVFCGDCTFPIQAFTFKNKDDVVQTWNKQEVIKRAIQHFGLALCSDCMRKRREANTTAEANKRVKNTKDVDVVDTKQAAAA